MMKLSKILKSFKYNPEFENLPGTIIYTKLKLCDWKNFDEDFKILKKLFLIQKKVNPHNLLFTYDSQSTKISSKKMVG